jgi:hypothetical protein
MEIHGKYYCTLASSLCGHTVAHLLYHWTNPGSDKLFQHMVEMVIILFSDEHSDIESLLEHFYGVSLCMQQLLPFFFP